MDTDRFAVPRKGTLLCINLQPDYPDDIEEKLQRQGAKTLEEVVQDFGYVFRYVGWTARDPEFPIGAESIATGGRMDFHPCEVTIAEEQDHD